MQLSLNNEEMELLNELRYSVGDATVVASMIDVAPMVPFADATIEFLNDVSRELMKSAEAKAFPDVVTLGFWLRKASLLQLKEKHARNDANIHLGRGVAFHVAPSNVPVNYAYSLVAGLLTGNANIVRIPSKEFPQVDIINKAINAALKAHEEMRPYVVLARYDRNQSINDVLSKICDTRIIWGGDNTIAELRKSPLGPRAGEITFADRYSLAVIDAEAYLETEDKKRIAQEFYNDTYLTDQNACTSPRIVVWTCQDGAGNGAVGEDSTAAENEACRSEAARCESYEDEIAKSEANGCELVREKAKTQYWAELHELVAEKYNFQPIQGVNKLTSSYLAAAELDGTRIEDRDDNLIVRVNVKECDAELMNLKDNSGYFFEYDCEDILEIRDLCNDTRCQTIGYLCDKNIFEPLILSGIKGVDRIVPIGSTMNFELIWDGYDLVERLTRTVALE